MNQEQFWILLSKKLANEANSEELAELERLIQAHPEWQYATQNLEELWMGKSVADQQQSEDAYLLHVQRMKDLNIPFGDQVGVQPLYPRRRVRWYWAAAALVLLLGVFALFRFRSGTSPQADVAIKEVNEISTRMGSKSKVKLPDGTVVWLNAGSKLTYNKTYGQTLREVNLSGEGYFDVVKMKDKPFIINTADIRIKVLGTVFNVKAYPQDKKTETSLIRGSIEVTINNRPSDKYFLSPNEKLVVENDEVLMKTGEKVKGSSLRSVNTPLISLNKLNYSTADSTLAETEWINNRLVFRDESLEELAVKMERWYNMNIEIRDEDLKQTRVSGIFDSETIDQALEALKISIRFHYEQEGNNIIIHR